MSPQALCRWCRFPVVQAEGVGWRSLDDDAPGELHYHVVCFMGPMVERLAVLMQDLTALWSEVAVNPSRVFDATQQMDELCEFLWPLPPDARTVLVTQVHGLRGGSRWGVEAVSLRPPAAGAVRHNVH